jgi:hypothetical protein
MREMSLSLEDLELYVYALRHVVVHCLDDSRDRREGDGAQDDEALEGAEGNGAAHEDGAKVFCMPAICRDKVRLGIARRHIGKRSSWTAIDAQLVRPRLGCDTCLSQNKGNQNAMGTHPHKGREMAVTCGQCPRRSARSSGALRLPQPRPHLHLASLTVSPFTLTSSGKTVCASER